MNNKKIWVIVALLVISGCATNTVKPPKDDGMILPQGHWLIEDSDIFFCFNVNEKLACSKFPKESLGGN